MSACPRLLPIRFRSRSGVRHVKPTRAGHVSRPAGKFAMVPPGDVSMIDRRRILALLAGVTTLPSLARAQVTRMTAYAFSFTGLKGGDIKLADYAGKVVLVVN